MTFVGRRVLVVEDEFLVSLTIIDLLEGIGCDNTVSLCDHHHNEHRRQKKSGRGTMLRRALSH